MYKLKIPLLFPFCMLLIIGNALAQAPGVVALSAVNGVTCKPQTIVLSNRTALKANNFKFSGPDKENFKIISFSAGKAVIGFTPAAGSAGVKHATLTVNGGSTPQTFKVHGLCTDGNEEPSLASIVDALGYKINLGWQILANNELPEMQGDEIPAELFKKSEKGQVIVQPLARYSPDFDLAFGYYNIVSHIPAEKQVGMLGKSGQFAQHQSLLPDVASAFDPGSGEFGLFAKGPDHTTYSEDVWNKVFFPDLATHAKRVYAAKDAAGKSIPNNYLVCFEDAANGDYNDYVFLIKNVTPVTENKFISVFNGKDLTGFHTYLQNVGNTDPDHLFRVEDGAVHVVGKLQGYAITDKSYADFDLKVDFKWGVDKWPPRQNNKRDGGLLYNIPAAEPDSIWPKSIEFQIQEGDVGDFWMLGFSTLRVNGKVNRPTNHIGVPKKRDNEKPYGEWNTIEVVSYSGKCVQIVNGVVVNYGDQCSVKNGGRFCLQSEYSEIYYKNVRIREL
ncbi:MAG: DUF1080 domain-containing protein [Bacteroidota bacterium]